jgi:hypothetical protein
MSFLRLSTASSTGGPPYDLQSLPGNELESNMLTRSSNDHDFVTVARRVVEEAIGEHLNGTPLENPDEGKNPHAVALGRRKGGKARARKLSAKNRSQ